MSQDQESFNRDLYNLLKVRGFKPVPLNTQNQRVPASQAADVIQFTFVKNDKEYGKAWITLDDTKSIVVYYDSEQQESPNGITPGVDYDDTWSGFLKHLKKWAQRRQLSFDLTNKDRLGDDMRQRDYYKMKSKLGESYHPMGKKASYNDAVPNVKIVLQHNRALEEGEQRYRNISKIYLENVDGERFLAPTTKPGIARVYARHIAEGGVPNDDRWNHIKSLCEEYNKMGGFIRATKTKEFAESAQEMISEGVNHYNNLRETLKKLAGHRGYSSYFESWSPSLMEEEGDFSLSELFVQETMDPRIESAIPILAKLKRPAQPMKEVDSLEEWADSLMDESLDITESEDVYLKQSKQDFNKESKDSLADTEIDESIGSDLKSFLHQYPEAQDAMHNAVRHFEYAYDAMDHVAGHVLHKMPYSEWEKVRPVIIDYFKKYGLKADDVNDVNEDLGPEQKRAGQLGPTEKVKNNNIGKLVGANESVEYADELARILNITNFNGLRN